MGFPNIPGVKGARNIGESGVAPIFPHEVNSNELRFDSRYKDKPRLINTTGGPGTPRRESQFFKSGMNATVKVADNTGKIFR